MGGGEKSGAFIHSHDALFGAYAQAQADGAKRQRATPQNMTMQQRKPPYFSPLPRARRGWTGPLGPEPKDLSWKALPLQQVDAAGNRSLSGAAGAARGRRGSLERARPAFALILMGDWCAFFKGATPGFNPGDEGAQPPDLQRPGPAQRIHGRGEKNNAAKGKTCLLTGAG